MLLALNGGWNTRTPLVAPVPLATKSRPVLSNASDSGALSCVNAPAIEYAGWLALVNGGGYAEYCIAEATSCLPVPTNLSMIEAAAIPEGFFTVWHNVFERGGLKSGETAPKAGCRGRRRVLDPTRNRRRTGRRISRCAGRTG